MHVCCVYVYAGDGLTQVYLAHGPYLRVVADILPSMHIRTRVNGLEIACICFLQSVLPNMPGSIAVRALVPGGWVGQT